MSLLYLNFLLHFVLSLAENRTSLCEEQFEFECGADSEPKCIPKRLKCNNLKDCSNGIDESGCVYAIQCPSNSLLCANGRCLDQSYRCNDIDECTDGSDEVGCAFHKPIWCPSNRFHCKLGPCIHKSVRCDGHTDCPYADDEHDCPKLADTSYCKPGEYRCELTDVCIPNTWVCDGMSDCEDDSDERNCVQGKLLPKHDTVLPHHCTNSQFACRDENNQHKCINRHQLCDGKTDCADGSDEGGLCHQCPSHKCEQKCTENPLGPICSCSDGMTLKSDRHSCQERNECTDGISNCEHYCHNTNGSYYCSCAPNYELQSDGHSCHFKQSRSGLLLASYGRCIPLNSIFEPNATFSPMVSNSVIESDIRSIDYNSNDGHLYMAVPVSGRIYMFSIKEVCLLDNLSGLSNIAIDWVTDNIYYTVETPSIYEGIGVCRSDGRFCRHLISGQDLDRFDGLIVHPRHGLMFWLIWVPNDLSRIEMAHMDGQQRQVIVKEKLSWPNGLAVDYNTNKLYFSDAQLGTIERIDIFSKKREIVINQGIHHPNVLLVFDEMLFWTDRDNKYLLSAPLGNANDSQPTLLTSFNHLPYSLTLSNPVYQDGSIENPCVHAGCSHICVLQHIDHQSDKPTATCLCPSGYRGFHSVVASGPINQTQCIPIEDENFDRATLPHLCVDSFMTLCSRGEACGSGGCMIELETAPEKNNVRCSCPEGLTGHYCEIDTTISRIFQDEGSVPKLEEVKSNSIIIWTVTFSIVSTILLILGVLICVYIRKTNKEDNKQLFPVMVFRNRSRHVAPEHQLFMNERSTKPTEHFEKAESLPNSHYYEEMNDLLAAAASKISPSLPNHANGTSAQTKP